ncbi:MAG: hypothetical protein HOC74_44385 [Gemmatimonadetes bacterium]|jgi:hypothetical protein|nr:hypothetical protein [Gemmatimonadota bacterium]
MLDESLGRLIAIELNEIDALLKRSAEMLATPNDAEPSFERLAALSQVLTSFYTGLERIFERIARQLDQALPEGERWHIQLLNQVARPTGNREALISDASRQRLRDYLAFRHRSRHPYAHHLEWHGMKHLVAQMQETWVTVRLELERFTQYHTSTGNGE